MQILKSGSRNNFKETNFCTLAEGKLSLAIARNVGVLMSQQYSVILFSEAPKKKDNFLNNNSVEI